MGDTVLRIEKLENGYEVEICDPAIMAKNQKAKSMVWADPWKGYAFDTAAEVSAFVGVHLDSLKPPPGMDEEYDSAFKSATQDDEKDPAS